MALRQLRHTYKEVWPKGHHNPSFFPVVKVGRKTYVLASGSGSRDSVTVYREGDQLYVLCVNRGMPYVGLERFDVTHHDRKSEDPTAPVQPAGEVFLQVDYAIEETLGKRGVDQAERTLVRKLIDYVYG